MSKINFCLNLKICEINTSKKIKSKVVFEKKLKIFGKFCKKVGANKKKVVKSRKKTTKVKKGKILLLWGSPFVIRNK